MTEADLTLDALAAGSPGWEVWRRPDGVYCAWHVGAQPPLVLHAATVDGLREAIGPHRA
jgi:hypothetical protein